MVRAFARNLRGPMAGRSWDDLPLENASGVASKSATVGGKAVATALDVSEASDMGGGMPVQKTLDILAESTCD